MAENSQPPKFVRSSSGATITTLGTQRGVNLYGVVERELDRLSSLSTESDIFFSVGSGFIGYAVDWFRAWYAKAPPGSLSVAVAFGVAGGVCLCIALVKFFQRRGITADYCRYQKKGFAERKLIFGSIQSQQSLQTFQRWSVIPAFMAGFTSMMGVWGKRVLRWNLCFL